MANFDLRNAFNENGIAWIPLKEPDTSKEYNALVKTNGEVLYLSDPTDFHCSKAGEVTTTPFVNGFSVVYVYGKPGFKVINECGDEVYEDGEMLVGRHTTDGNLLLLKHESGFDHDYWEIYVLDTDFNLRNTHIQNADELYKDDIEIDTICENIYSVHEASSLDYYILNLKNNFWDQFVYEGAGREGDHSYKYVGHNDEYMFSYVGYGDNTQHPFVPVCRYCKIPIQVLADATAPGQIPEESFAIVQDVSGECLEYTDWKGGSFYSWVIDWDGDGIKDKIYTDFNGDLIMKYPTFAAGVEIKGIDFFSGGYSAMYLTGVDGKDYLTIVNENGEIQYDPKQKDYDIGPVYQFGSSCCGYIFTGDNIIAPDGTDKTLGDNLPGLSDVTCVLSKIHTVIGGGYILNWRDLTYYATDGSGVIDLFTANYNSNGNLVYTNPNGEKELSSVTYEVPESNTNPVKSTQPGQIEKNYITVDDFSIEGKWKNVGETTWGQAQTGAIIVFDGKNCNYFSPSDTYAFYMDGDDYKLDCTSPLGDTISSTVKIVDDNNIDIYSGSTVIELTRVG